MNMVEEFLASNKYSDSTKDTYRRIYKKVLSGQKLEDLTAGSLVGLVQSHGWGNSQQCVAVAACRKFLRWRFGANHPALSAKIKVIPTKPQPRLSREQINVLIDSFDLSTEIGLRNRAIVAVALDSNLRATELCNLEMGNVDLDGCKLYALVKGGQWVWKVFSQKTAYYVREWTEVRSPALGVSTLFISFHHQRLGKPLTRSGLQQVMKRWDGKVGFHVNPHMFRRSYASQSTLAGAPKNVVKAGGGWKADRMVDHYIGDLELEFTRPYLPTDHLED